MKVLIIGAGAREHALVKALKHSPELTELHVLPGNDGMKKEAIVHNFSWTDSKALMNLLNTNAFDIVIIGPEDPLAAGLADHLRAQGIKVFGPSQASAQLEASKIFAKQFMFETGIPTARGVIVKSTEHCLRTAKTFKPPFVLKADGLAAGKGVFICSSDEELKKAAQQIFDAKIFGKAGEQALLEEFMPGYELSYLILTNGKDYVSLPLSQDHKRLLDGQQGPNTGGMGTYAPITIDNDLHARIHNEILQPTVEALEARQMDYRGVLFLGLMITEEGPKVLEYNVRFGDPETQVILPLLKSDWLPVFTALAEGKLPHEMIWDLQRHCSCVVLAAPGYPEKPEKNIPIQGDPLYEDENHWFCHAGTLLQGSEFVTNGGRVLNAIARADSPTKAREQAYALIQKVNWAGMHFRKDIGVLETLD